MAYDGEVLNECGIIPADFSKTYVIAVSGSGPNVCGHLLLYVDSQGGYYFHVAEIHGFPHYMTEAGYRRYLQENGKRELRRLRVTLPNPGDAHSYLEGLMADTWTWLAVPNNCVAFVEEVIAAGGGTWASTSNCPSLATAPTISERAQQFINRLEAEIYNLYGVPRF